ncbi:hypothetical protein TELCIR_06773 [Teladorsagia circumcincta]|uniref:Methanethiol oxidase n=1 Tax=Teladorsagia circumcincta TaxID=45464 RepID=A0A2G9UMF6_TELCI|nr:hypothetical protein TELCIR_06773 [Teladorsagia circumcincta]
MFRFLHEPTSPYAFAGTTLGSCVFLFHPKFASTKYDAKCVVKVPSKKVEGCMLPEMPSLITDIIISMDDHYLYISNWVHGDVRQYDITDPENPRLNSQFRVMLHFGSKQHRGTLPSNIVSDIRFELCKRRGMIEGINIGYQSCFRMIYGRGNCARDRPNVSDINHVMELDDRLWIVAVPIER